jgi:membrane protease YdiL (CAAX protease family)
VAANEELGFRGLFFEYARRWQGARWACWTSTLLFVAMHFGYEPMWDLPFIFLVGMSLGRLRSLGASMTTLILVHLGIDGYWALKLPEVTPQGHLPYILLGSMLALGWIALEFAKPPKGPASLA